MFLLGEPFTAARAAELGLVNRVLPDRDLLATATATAQKLAAKPAGALLASKRLIKRASIGQLREAAKFESREFSERVHSAEATEAFTAFREKRPPNFTNLPKPLAAE
jgi:enoyl-CoA hydratase/carnithine racemase